MLVLWNIILAKKVKTIVSFLNNNNNISEFVNLLNPDSNISHIMDHLQVIIYG